MVSLSDGAIPEPIRTVLRGIGQVFFQENALTGACFVVGIALASPLLALGVLVGSAIGAATGWALKFDRAEVTAGIYGFNSALVGIAILFFFRPGAVSVGLLIVGCIVTALVTWLVRRHVPFPTYTAPFVVMTWALYFLALGMGAAQVAPSGPPAATGFIAAVAHGIGQVMFQASIWTALLFVIGIAISDWQHALWVIAGSALGMLVGIYHHDSPEEGACARALRLQRDTRGGCAVPLASIADCAGAGHLAVGAPDRVHAAAGYTGPDGSFRAGDLAGTCARLVRRQAFQSPARSAA